MRKRINLLKANKKFVETESAFLKLKNFAILIFFIFLAVNLALFFFILRQNQKLSALTEQKQLLLNFLIDNKEADAKFSYFRGKEKQIKQVLLEDVNFYPYYNLLKDSLDKFAVGANLYSVTIDKTKATSFTISFQNYDNLIDFLRFAESDEFLKNFNQLSLVKFSRNDTQLSKNDYRLNFVGSFINLK